MTFKERLQKEYPEKAKKYFGCPKHLGYEDENKKCHQMSCIECWNREISKEKENTTQNLGVHTEQFICSKCELHLEDFAQQIYDEDEDETYSVDFEFLYCPGCGRKVVD